MKKYLTKIETEKLLSIVDLSNDKNGTHSINLILNEIKSNLSKLGIPINMISDSPITTSEKNYDMLYYPKNDITRNSVYTKWISETNMLRTHTTSMVCDKLIEMSNGVIDDEIMLLHGLVYRRDVIDKTHVSEPHQLDIWRLSKDIKHTRENLLELVKTVIDSILPNVNWRYTETNHHYTQNGIEVEVEVNNEWMEILECGEILPQLLEDCGIDSKSHSGLALGIGLDRAVMIKKGISDIRVLRSDNTKIQKQMLDLNPYKEISKYNTVNRDLSICILEEYDDEVLGDLIRKLDLDLDLIEEIKIKQEWLYNELPDNVKEKLGITKGYKNILMSITLSSLEKELNKKECNDVYNIIYENINMCDNVYIIKE